MEKNYFALFRLPLCYEVDFQLLQNRYHQLQSRFHPDRFATIPHEQAYAVRYSAHINEAFTTLMDPLQRAEYLLRLKHGNAGSESKTMQDGAFLVEQMHWREMIEEAEDASVLQALEGKIEQEMQQQRKNFSEWYANNTAMEKLQTLVCKMQFMNKLKKEVQHKRLSAIPKSGDVQIP